MKSSPKRFCLVLALFLVTARVYAASPCAGMKRVLTEQRKAAVAPAIARHLKAQKVDVLQSFQSGDWSIFYVETHETENVYVFYAHDPLTSRYVTLWSGVAESDEGPAIKAWILKHAPGIPRSLASCFAWHVTPE
jgi:hypothetical protein